MLLLPRGNLGKHLARKVLYGVMSLEAIVFAAEGVSPFVRLFNVAFLSAAIAELDCKGFKAANPRVFPQRLQTFLTSLDCTTTPWVFCSVASAP